MASENTIQDDSTAVTPSRIAMSPEEYKSVRLTMIRILGGERGMPIAQFTRVLGTEIVIGIFKEALSKDWEEEVRQQARTQEFRKNELAAKQIDHTLQYGSGTSDEPRDPWILPENIEEYGMRDRWAAKFVVPTEQILAEDIYEAGMYIIHLFRHRSEFERQMRQFGKEALVEVFKDAITSDYMREELEDFESRDRVR